MESGDAVRNIIARYADDTLLMAEKVKNPKNFLMKVKARLKALVKIHIESPRS